MDVVTDRIRNNLAAYEILKEYLFSFHRIISAFDLLLTKYLNIIYIAHNTTLKTSLTGIWYIFWLVEFIRNTSTTIVRNIHCMEHICCFCLIFIKDYAFNSIHSSTSLGIACKPFSRYVKNKELKWKKIKKFLENFFIFVSRLLKFIF